MSDTNDARVPTWVRAVMIATLSVPQLVVGIWAVIAPRHWYDSFPGFDPRLIAAEPPFNQHLATDSGAGFLATGAAVLVAAILARRSGVYVALAAYVCFAVPHLLYHATHAAPGLTSSQSAINVALLGCGLIWVFVVAWGVRRSPGSDQSLSASKAT